MRKPISVQKKVAVTLYYLSDGGRMRKTATNAFGLAVSSVSVFVKNVTQAISKHLASTYLYIKLPISEQEVQQLSANFISRFAFPSA